MFKNWFKWLKKAEEQKAKILRVFVGAEPAFIMLNPNRDLVCSDCKEKGCIFQHWGPLVPKGKTGNFCGFCWEQRRDRYEKGKKPLRLGVKPPGIPKIFANHVLEVTTYSKSVYRLELTKKNDEQIISRNKGGLSFTRARVMCLEIGKSLVLKPLDDREDNFDLWFTTPVTDIKSY